MDRPTPQRTWASPRTFGKRIAPIIGFALMLWGFYFFAQGFPAGLLGAPIIGAAFVFCVIFAMASTDRTLSLIRRVAGVLLVLLGIGLLVVVLNRMVKFQDFRSLNTELLSGHAPELLAALFVPPFIICAGQHLLSRSGRRQNLVWIAYWMAYVPAAVATNIFLSWYLWPSQH